jgi:hypothetical protein
MTKAAGMYAHMKTPTTLAAGVMTYQLVATALPTASSPDEIVAAAAAAWAPTIRSVSFRDDTMIINK